MGDGLGQLYVQKVLTAESKQRAKEMVEKIHAALKVRI